MQKLGTKQIVILWTQAVCKSNSLDTSVEATQQQFSARRQPS